MVMSSPLVQSSVMIRSRALSRKQPKNFASARVWQRNNSEIILSEAFPLICNFCTALKVQRLETSVANLEKYSFLYTQLCVGNDVLKNSFFRSTAVISILEPSILSYMGRLPQGHLLMFQRATLQGQAGPELELNLVRCIMEQILMLCHFKSYLFVFAVPQYHWHEL